MDIKNIFLSKKDTITEYLNKDSPFNEMSLKKLTKGYISYSIILSILVTIFSYKFTKSYYTSFDYNYFQEQDTYDIYWFTFMKLEFIEILFEAIVIYVFLISLSMIYFDFIKKIILKTETKTETGKLKYKVLLGFFLIATCIITPYLILTYRIGGISDMFNLFVFILIFMFLLSLSIHFKTFSISLFGTILLFIFAYISGKKVGLLLGEEAIGQKKRMFIKENDVIHLNYLITKKDSLLYKHKYIIGENTINYIIYDEKENVFFDIKKSRITTKKIKRLKQ